MKLRRAPSTCLSTLDALGVWCFGPTDSNVPANHRREAVSSSLSPLALYLILRCPNSIGIFILAPSWDTARVILHRASTIRADARHEMMSCPVRPPPSDHEIDLRTLALFTEGSHSWAVFPRSSGTQMIRKKMVAGCSGFLYHAGLVSQARLFWHGNRMRSSRLWGLRSQHRAECGCRPRSFQRHPALSPRP